MINRKKCCIIGIGYVCLTYAVSLYLNGNMQGSYLFLYGDPNVSLNGNTVLLGVTLWFVPRLLISAYLAYSLFLFYKKTYAYYYVRTRNPKIWLRKVIVRLWINIICICLFKLFVALIFQVSLSYAFMMMIEFLLLLLLTLTFFIMIILINDEKAIAISVMIYILMIFSLVETKNSSIMNTILFYNNINIYTALLVLINLLCYKVIYNIVKKKEFYY